MTPARLQRPRSLRAHDQVLDATIKLFCERGIDGASIDAIAALSGVSKATVYKHWPDKSALALEALSRVHGLDRERPVFDSGDLRQDLIDFLNHKPPEEFLDARDRLMPHVVAYAARDQEFGKKWRTHLTGPMRTQVFELMGRGIAAGQFPADLDKQLGVALLVGPMMYRHIFRDAAPFKEDLAEGVVNAFWRAFAIQSAPAKAKPRRKRMR